MVFSQPQPVSDGHHLLQDDRLLRQLRILGSNHLPAVHQTMEIARDFGGNHYELG